MPESSSMHRYALVLAAATIAALLFASPVDAAKQADELPPMPPEKALADKPFLIQQDRRWLRHAEDAVDPWVTAEARSGESISDAYERLTQTPGVERVAFNYRYRAHGVPNDPLFSAQWHLQQIKAPEAWDHADGTGVTVAVLDSGVGLGGEDLTCHTFVHPYNGITDEVGLVALTDENGHGTHVTGTVAQCTDNGIGLAGVAHGATIMPVKVMDHEAETTTETLSRGMAWAIEHGADVINLSLGFDCDDIWPECSDYVIDFLIETADEADIVVVASTGNGGAPFVSFPANHPLTIAVGATKISDEPAGYSAYGTALDVLAPGGSKFAGVWQETFDHSGVWGYYAWNGTSMAAPHVAGTVALMLSVDPSLQPAVVKEMLRGSAVDLGEPGWDETSGSGRIDALAAVNAARHDPGDPCPIDTVCDGVLTVAESGEWSLKPVLPDPPTTDFYYGVPGDIAFSGDWNCDGARTPGLYRQSDGYVYLRDSNTEGIADREFHFGDPGDIPLAGDFNGDGCETVSLYRATEGRVYVINRLGEDGGGLGAADFDFYFGDPGDKPFTGDFDGDGIDTVGLHRESTGLVYFRNSNSQGTADSSFIYGDPGDQILTADWNSDGFDTVAVYRPSTATLYVKLANTQGVADHQYVIGPYAHVVRAGQS